MYLDGTDGHSLLYLDARLKNRSTIIEWDKHLMGPIYDQQGVEQGGPNSSEQYKLYNNEQLSVAQLSHFGFSIGSEVISSVGQADDSVFISSDFNKLAHLLKLTLNYCKKYHVIMTPEKTKLLVFSPDKYDAYSEYYRAVDILKLTVFLFLLLTPQSMWESPGQSLGIFPISSSVLPATRDLLVLSCLLAWQETTGGTLLHLYRLKGFIASLCSSQVYQP